MKKSFMAAALAACLVGAAQAVSVGWNTLEGTEGAVDLSGTPYTCGVNETKTYAVIVSNVSGLVTGGGINTLLAISAGYPASGGDVPNADPKIFIKQRGDGDGTSTFKYQKTGSDMPYLLVKSSAALNLT